MKEGVVDLLCGNEVMITGHVRGPTADGTTADATTNHEDRTNGSTARYRKRPIVTGPS